jgi:hypothetical protein
MRRRNDGQATSCLAHPRRGELQSLVRTVDCDPAAEIVRTVTPASSTPANIVYTRPETFPSGTSTNAARAALPKQIAQASARSHVEIMWRGICLNEENREGALVSDADGLRTRAYGHVAGRCLIASMISGVMGTADKVVPSSPFEGSKIIMRSKTADPFQSIHQSACAISGWSASQLWNDRVIPPSEKVLYGEMSRPQAKHPSVNFPSRRSQTI